MWNATKTMKKLVEPRHRLSTFNEAMYPTSSGYFFCNEFTNGPLTQNLKGVNELPKMQQKKENGYAEGKPKVETATTQQ